MLKPRALLLIPPIAFVSLAIALYLGGLHRPHPEAILQRGEPGTRRLIVVVKAGATDIAGYRPLVGRLLTEPQLAGSDVLYFDHHVSKLAVGHLYDLATRLRADVDAQWIRHGGYDDIILAGHSTGSLLMRDAYLQSAGRDPRQPRTVGWSDRVSRIVLMAGIGRGVDAEERGRWRYVLSVARFIPVLRSTVMYDVLRGADFVTEVRIAWIRHFTELQRAAEADASAPRPPIVVQLQGTEDDVLHRDDNIDLEQFPTAFHIDVPGGGHTTLHRLERTPDPELTYALFREAFVSPRPAHAATHRAAPDSVEHVVFLLHGMRTSRDKWVHELAPLVRERLPHAEVVESSYGWTSMLGFALPSVRRRELKWLQDAYTEQLARHPRAAFDVVAHSNGAYLVGESLERVASMKFHRLLLLGSVLPSDYSWRQRREWGQAEVVRADRSPDDLIVAVLCNALRGIGMTDLGTSGWSGFDDSGGVETQNIWYRGGHAAGVAAHNLPGIADFLAGASAPGVQQASMTMGMLPTRALVVLSHLAPWLARLIVLTIMALAGLWLWRGGRTSPKRLGIVAAGVLLVVIAFDVL